MATLMLQTWAMRAAREGYKKAKVEAPIYGQVQASILDLRRNCAWITNSERSAPLELGTRPGWPQIRRTLATGPIPRPTRPPAI